MNVKECQPEAQSRPRSVGDRYELISELGRGGAARVYRARDMATDAIVALKRLEHATPEAVALFEREYRVLASLRHPRIIEVYDYGVDAATGRLYYTMELLEGDDLRGLAPVPWKLACTYLRDTAASLALVHARKLIHRDVSPRNVRVDARGRAKLIDFGLLADMGVADEVVGTTICMAPEVFEGRSVDQRADLYALGVTSYWALTGRLPYAVETFGDLVTAWQTHAIPPSRHVPGIPQALDDLVLSLVSLDSMARPASAAEVVNRLSGIVGLSDGEVEELTLGCLWSVPLVGREAETADLRRRIERAVGGRGRSVVVHGASGMGKSRFLGEIVIESRLRGAATVRVDALAHPEHLGVARALARGILLAVPTVSPAALAPFQGVLGVEFGLLRGRASIPDVAPDDRDREARIQTALLDWISDVASVSPLCIAVDDVQASDAASAGVLLGLAYAARGKKLLLASTALDGGAVAAVEKLLAISARVTLGPLDVAPLDELVGAVFGRERSRTRLSHWLARKGGGHPAQTVGLVRYLIEQQIARYAEGAWILPDELPEEDLPAGPDGIVRAQLSRLSLAARGLAEKLSLREGAASPELCARVEGAASALDVAPLLEELVRHGVVTPVDGGYRVAHESIRDVLAKSLTDERRRAIHATIGAALVALRPELLDASSATSPQGSSWVTELLLARLLAGHHLIAGGDPSRGAALVRSAAVQVLARGEGLAGAAPSIERSLALLRPEKAYRWDCRILVLTLAAAGYWIDWRYTDRYGAEAVAIAGDLTGLTIARRLAPFCGRHVAIVVGLVVAALLFRVGTRRRVASDFSSFREAFTCALTAIACLMGSFYVIRDVVKAHAMLKVLEPLQALPARSAGAVIYRHQAWSLSSLRSPAVCEEGAELLPLIESPEKVRDLAPHARATLGVSVHATLALCCIWRPDDSLLPHVRSIEKSKLESHRQSPHQFRAVYRAFRGERRLADEENERVEVFAARSGGTWRADILYLVSMVSAYALTDDVVGSHRVLRTLESLAADLETLGVYRDAARIAYAVSRGRHDEASPLVERFWVDHPGALWDAGGAVKILAARVLNELRRHAEAKVACEAALAQLTAGERVFSMQIVSLELELARAQAALGDSATARARLRSVTAEHDAHENPLVHGLIHRTGAQIALLETDAVAFREHLGEMNRWFRSTENQALVGQCEKLERDGFHAGLVEWPESGARAAVTGLELSETLQASSDVFQPDETLEASSDVSKPSKS